MKLVLNGHSERYVVEQSLMNLFPGELPVYEPIGPEDTSWAVVSLTEEEGTCHVDVELAHGGGRAVQHYDCTLSGSGFEREGQRRHAVGACFFLAYRALTGISPPWGMLTGVRPDKPVTWALEEGKSPEEARRLMEEFYYVTPGRAALALETGTTAAQAVKRLEARDIDVYVGNIGDTKVPTENGDLKPLAILAEERSAIMPDLPTVEELTGSLVTASSSRGIAVKAGTDPAIVEKLEEAFAEAAQTDSFKQSMLDQGIEAIAIVGDDYMELLKQEEAELKELAPLLGW